jgi:hypothetical protein
VLAGPPVAVPRHAELLYQREHIMLVDDPVLENAMLAVRILQRADREPPAHTSRDMRARGPVPNGADRRSPANAAKARNPDPDIDASGNRGLHGFPLPCVARISRTSRAS